jgi:hypothetical protein
MTREISQLRACASLRQVLSAPSSHPTLLPRVNWLVLRTIWIRVLTTKIAPGDTSVEMSTDAIAEVDQSRRVFLSRGGYRRRQ